MITVDKVLRATYKLSEPLREKAHKTSVRAVWSCQLWTTVKRND